MQFQKSYLYFFAVFLLFVLQGRAMAQDAGENQTEIQKLKQQVAELQASIEKLQGEKQAVPEDSSDAALERELAGELGAEISKSTGSEQTIPGVQTRPAKPASMFQNMNPNISVIGTLLGGGTSLNSADRNVDLSLEESEFSFQAIVDPYAKADIFISFGQEFETPLTPGPPVAAEEPGGLSPEIEEGYVTLLSLPFSTQLKAGKFRSKFGKINETHPHAYNFINLPIVFTNFFGAEGLNDEGVSLSWLVPNGKFFQELTVEVTRGPLENESFARADDNHLLYLAHLTNLFDLNDNTTMELGFTGLTGPNNAEGETTQFFGADLTFKWKPVRFNRYKSFELMNEFLISKHNGVSEDVTSFGLYSFMRYQVAKRWFLGAMYDYSEFPEFDNFHRQAFSGIAQYFTTEFQKFETQIRFNEGDFFDNYVDFRVRAVFVIGAHGAHAY